jgi:hypothetical protein
MFKIRKKKREREIEIKRNTINKVKRKKEERLYIDEGVKGEVQDCCCNYPR